MLVKVPPPKEAALEYVRNGLSVIPIRTDGSKAPVVDWKPYQLKIPDDQMLEDWFQNDCGIGIVCGAVSGRVEVLDFDDPGCFEPWKERVLETSGTLGLLDRLVIMQTPSGGWHLIYRCSAGVGPNQKLAQRRLADGTIKTMIETRGEGGYVLAPGSPNECHHLGKPYKLVQGSLGSIPDLAAQDRELLLSAALSFNEFLPRESIVHGATGRGFKPGDDFNERGSWDFLKDAGWKFIRQTGDGTILVQRPRKSSPGISATVNHCGNELLYVFSTNASPFEPQRGYTRFAAYTLSIHGGDYRKASITLAYHGFGQMPLNDSGNAQRFVNLFWDEVRYVGAAKSWFVWDGMRWIKDDKSSVVSKAKEVAKHIIAEAQEITDRNRQAETLRWSIQAGNGGRIAQMLKLAQPELSISPDDLDSNYWLLNCLNGTVDLRTGECYPHRSGDLLTKLAPVNYVRGAPAPRFLRFLEEVFLNAGVRVFFQLVIGYSLTGDQREQKLFILTGDGANGKSTLMITLGSVLGDYKQEAAPGMLLAKNPNGITNDIARLKGARMVLTAETDLGRYLDEEWVKRLTGGDVITARFLYQEHFEFRSTHTLFIITNHKPSVKGQDHGIWRRLSVIPFNVTFPEDQQDKELPQKLMEEREGILAWAVEGCLKWQVDGLKEPPVVQAARSDYKTDNDPVSRFVHDSCREGGQERSGTLYHRYKKWAQDTGENVVSVKSFSQSLERLGFKKERDNKGACFEGLSLVEEEGDDDGSWRAENMFKEN